jgi:glycosyltransferase involved in cell wall biosynthesis
MERARNAAAKVLRILRAQFQLISKFLNVGRYDAMIVGSVGQFDIFTAKLLNLSRRKPLIFQVFISLYDTAVRDRKLVPERSFYARMLHWLDRFSCRLADVVVLDTDEHADYFHREFGVPRDKLHRVLVGADETVFRPQEKPTGDTLTVLFFGTFIPLHGTEYIVRAAKILESDKKIRFVIVGRGQEEERIWKLSRELGVKNVGFVKRLVDNDELVERIAGADICLGIFGDTGKARNVIPTKVYACLAMGKPVITADTRAAAELLKDGESALLCPPADAEALAERIAILRKDKALRESIAKKGYEAFLNRASTKAIGHSFREHLETIVR